MNKRRIVLFTAHSPAVGGGGAILRSLTANLSQLDIIWCYLNHHIVQGYEAGYLGQPMMGGPLLKDVLQTYKMLIGAPIAYIDDIVNKLLAIECDAYWIVSHNEGLRVAAELSKRKQSRHVHVTVHDDWAAALCARSVRYRLMSGIAQKLTVKVLTAITSFDVISTGMSDYYRLLTQRTGSVCHRYLPERAVFIGEMIKENDNILVGHIGSIYNKKDLFNFVGLSKEFFARKGKSVLLQMWGCHLTFVDVPKDLQQNIIFLDTLPEEEVIPLLNKCDFVYCMYPLTRALHTFSKTSLPTKLSSYVRAARPVFGHGPADSTLAEFVNSTQLGCMWSTHDKQQGFDALEKITGLKIADVAWQDARRAYFGEKNLQVMTTLLGTKRYV